ncbi:MAG: TfoX/Sxy family protein [Saprospiraceae bacterium]|nr:TfoX/Sxy family protein [Saprospiraceae bacterium]
MAYNEKLASRCREIIAETHTRVEEKVMFGGLCFMVNEKMCIGVEKDRIMLRINPDNYEELLELEGSKPMDFTGKIMKGYLFIDENVVNTKKKLDFWLQYALAYNKIANSSKKKTTSKKSTDIKERKPLRKVAKKK